MRAGRGGVSARGRVRREGAGAPRTLAGGLLAGALVAGVALGGCAWSNRANRPVWNAFEERLVPEGDVAFWSTLPLTVPGGFVAILTDTFVVHPVQVADDAWGDTRDVWRGIPWAEAYYTQLVVLPFRAAFTPVVLVLGFLWRSAFDVDEYRSPTEKELARRAAAERVGELPEPTTATRDVRLWLESLAGGGARTPPRIVSGGAVAWDEDMQRAFEAALRSASAAGRLQLHRGLRAHRLPPWSADPFLGLRDPDPVLRYLGLMDLSLGTRVPDALRRALIEDPSEMVRITAAARLAAG